MNKISLVIPYYKTKSIIPLKFKEWEEYDDDVKSNLEIVIIDDGSPEGTTFEEHWVNTNLNIKLFKIVVDIPWNEGGANNLGFKVASNDWVFRSDVDWSIPNDVMKKVMNTNLIKGNFYTFRALDYATKQAIGNPANIYVLHKEDFWKSGGYDEDTAGYHGSDISFRRRLFSIINAGKIHFIDGAVEAYVGASGEHGLIREAGAAFCEDLMRKKISTNTLMPTDWIRFEWKQIK